MCAIFDTDSPQNSPQRTASKTVAGRTTALTLYSQSKLVPIGVFYSWDATRKIACSRFASSDWQASE